MNRGKAPKGGVGGGCGWGVCGGGGVGCLGGPTEWGGSHHGQRGGSKKHLVTGRPVSESKVRDSLVTFLRWGGAQAGLRGSLFNTAPNNVKS